MALANLTDFFTTESTKPKAPKPGKKVATPQEKVIAQLNKEVEAFKSGKTYDSPAKARRAWIKDNDGEITVTARYGARGLDFGGGNKTLYTDRKRFDKGIKTLIAHIEAGSFNSQLEAFAAEDANRAKSRKPRASA